MVLFFLGRGGGESGEGWAIVLLVDPLLTIFDNLQCALSRILKKKESLSSKKILRKQSYYLLRLSILECWVSALAKFWFHYPLASLIGAGWGWLVKRSFTTKQMFAAAGVRISSASPELAPSLKILKYVKVSWLWLWCSFRSSSTLLLD